jgi:hypothetical protein
METAVIENAILEVVLGLDVPDLRSLKAELAAILSARDQAAEQSLINWHTMSSLELAGVIATIDVALLRAEAASQRTPTLTIQ